MCNRSYILFINILSEIQNISTYNAEAFGATSDFFHVQANPLIELLSLSNTQKATVSTFKAQHFLGN